MPVKVCMAYGMAEDYAVVRTTEPNKALVGPVLVAFPYEDREWVMILKQLGHDELSERLRQYWKELDRYGDTT